MKKILRMTIAAVLSMTGCMLTELLDVLVSDDGSAISFGTYIGGSAVTRAVPIDNVNLGVYGFGVQAWYTGLTDWTSFSEAYAGSAIPSENVFMNDTKLYKTTETDGEGNVTVTGEKWLYSPLKYWPNNAEEKVSFFAYAPHSSASANVSVSGTDVTYKVSSDVSEQVDLLYHDNTENNTRNLTRQPVGTTVGFKFEHALSKLGFKVVAANDVLNDDYGSGPLLPEGTKIEVKKVALVGDSYVSDALSGPFFTEGVLSLEDGTWSIVDESSTQGFVFTPSDNFVGGDVITLDHTNSNVLQPVLAEDSYLMVIPQSFSEGTSFKIYVEYDVTTSDSGLSDGSHVVENRITSGYLELASLEAGKSYTLNLILGMTTAKFSAVSEDWVDGNLENSDNPDNPDNPLDPSRPISGLGTEENPYEIWNYKNLAQMRDNINSSAEYPEGGEPWRTAYYIQMEDIDLSCLCGPDIDDGTTWTRVHDGFSGSYDGQGYEIRNLYGGGLFSNLSENAKVTNIHFVDALSCYFEQAKNGNRLL